MRSPRSKAAGCTSEAFFPSVSATYALAQPGGALRGLRSLALVRPTSTPEGGRAPSQSAAFASGSPSPKRRSAAQAAARMAASARVRPRRRAAGACEGANRGASGAASRAAARRASRTTHSYDAGAPGASSERRDPGQVLARIRVEERLLVGPGNLSGVHRVEQAPGTDGAGGESRARGGEARLAAVQRAERLQMAVVHRNGGIVAFERREQRLEQGRVDGERHVSGTAEGHVRRSDGEAGLDPCKRSRTGRQIPYEIRVAAERPVPGGILGDEKDAGKSGRAGAQHGGEEGLPPRDRERLVGTDPGAAPAGEDDRAGRGRSGHDTRAAKRRRSSGDDRTRSRASFACPRA